MAAAAKWAYNATVRNIIRLFVSGNITVQDVRSYSETFARYWYPKIPEEVRNADPLNSVWDFIAILTSIPADECNYLRQESFNKLLVGISRLESAFKDAVSLSTSGEKDVGLTGHLKKLLGRVVGQTIIAFSHNKHQSRILYNQYKSMMTRHQQQGCELVLKGLLPAEKVLQSESEYMKAIKELLESIVNSTSNLIDDVSERAGKNCTHDDGLMKWVIEDTNVESSDESEVHIIASSDEMAKNYAASSIPKQKNYVNAKETQGKHPSNRSCSKQGSKNVADSSSKIHNTALSDENLMPPPLFMTKSKSQRKIPKVSKKQKITKPPEIPVIFRKAGRDSGNKSITSSSTSYSTRTKHSFTPLQDAYIIFGMMKCHKNKQLWVEIFKKYPFPEYRTPTHLKDRWRTLLKRGDVHMEGEKIVASPKYEAIFKHLYTKYEKDNKWEWKGKQSSKRRLITLDDDEELDDLSIDDRSDDSDLPKQRSSSRSAVLEWLGSNSGIPDKEARATIPAKEVTDNEKPETSGTFVMSNKNGEIMHLSDEETPPDTGQVVLKPSKSKEYVANVHGKFIPNSHNKTSTKSVHANSIYLHNENFRPGNAPSAGSPKGNPTDTSVDYRQSKSTSQSSSVQNVTDVIDQDSVTISSVQNIENEERVPNSQSTSDDEIDKELNEYFNIQSNNEVLDTPHESLPAEESVVVDGNSTESSLEMHVHKSTDVHNTNSDKSEQYSDVSMSHELLKLTEKSLHCELMREEEISFVTTESDTTEAQMETDVAKASPGQLVSSKIPISSVPTNDSQKNLSEDIQASQKNQSKIDCCFQPMEYPASPSTYRTISPGTSSVYVTADEDSEFGTESENNEKTLCSDQTIVVNTPTTAAGCCYDNEDQQNAIHGSRRPPGEANLSFMDSHRTSPILSSTRVNCDIPIAELCQSAFSQTSPIEIHGDTGSASPPRIQKAVKSQNVHGIKEQTVHQNSSAKKQKKSTDEASNSQHILTRRQVAQIRMNHESLSNGLIQGRALRSGLRNRDENRKQYDTSTTDKSLKELRKRLRSNDNRLNTANSESTENNSSQQSTKFRRKKRQLEDPGLPLKLSKEDEAWLNDNQANNINPEAFDSHKPRQGSRKKWSNTEDKNLMEGVKVFGEGKWKTILDKYTFSNRTAGNLKDRYRVLKQSYSHKTSIPSS